MWKDEQGNNFIWNNSTHIFDKYDGSIEPEQYEGDEENGEI